MKKRINLSKIIALTKKRNSLLRYMGREEFRQAEMVLRKETDKVDAAIQIVEKRKLVRKLSIEDILRAIARAEQAWNLPRKYMEGIKISVDVFADDFSRRYKGIPESTQFTAEFTKGKWYLTDVYREACRGYGHNILAEMPDVALDYISNRAKEKAVVITMPYGKS